MPWTDEMVEDLKKMWKEGLSTGEIGKRLGVSKNSIVGKVHRLQLVSRPSPIKKKDDAQPAAKEKSKPAPKESRKPEAKEEPEPVAKEAPKAKEKSPAINQPKAEAKPSLKKEAPEKETEMYMNVSIPVVHSPKKPGDKITVTDLDNHTCRWPIGDPKDENFHFCGAPVKIGQTYCEEHAAIAYVKNLKK